MVTKNLCFSIHTFLCTFILAAVSKPILGVDFLSAHRLLVDLFFCCVLDAATLRPVGPATTASPPHSCLTAALCHVAPAVPSLLASFPSIVRDGSGKPRPKHRVCHTIETTGCPVFAKSHWLDPVKLRIAKAELCSLEKAGIIRLSKSP